MRCMTCGLEMVERQATAVAPYAYTLSGLKDVFLEGIAIHKCGACGEEFPIIPRVGELHGLIAMSLVKQESPLRGDEVRFLRKNAGFQGGEFAALMGVSATYLSKIENGRLKLGLGADKLVRLLASADEKRRGLLIEIAKDLKPARKPRKVVHKPVFKLEKHRWLQAVA
jgi:YgiT-type zinc finger domain-containing protein